jgi:hypothetical protein
MGKIVDEKKALKKCHCRKINPHQKDSKMICYSEGVLGTLDEGQTEECQKIDLLPTSKTQQRHFEKFKELGAVSGVCLSNEEGQTTEDFYKCIAREADKQR